MAYIGNQYPIPLGYYGLVTDLPPADIPRGALILANNVSFETGNITKAPGSRRYNSSALDGSVVALHDWWPNSTFQRLIAVTSAGSIYRDIGDNTFSSGVAITTGLLSLTPNAVFVEGGAETQGRDKKLFLFTGTNQLKVLSGDSIVFGDVDLPAADWTDSVYPRFGFTHRGRMWAFYGNRWVASTTGDHEDFQSGTILTGAIYPGEGGELIGGWIFKGRPFVFKEGGFVYYLDDSDPDSENWIWRKIANNFGLASPHSVIETTNDMLTLNESGALISYSAVDTYGGVDSADVFKLLNIAEFIRNKTSLAGIRETHALYYEDKKQLFITSRSAYKTSNDLLLHFDFNKQNTRVSLWDKDSVVCLAKRKDLNGVQRPIYGDANGYVYLMDREDRLTHSTAYKGEFKTAHHDFRDLDPVLAKKNKIFDHLAVEFIPQGNWDLSIDVFIDGKFIETIPFKMEISSNGLDSFTLGSGGGSGLTTPEGGDGDPLGREESQTLIKPLHGTGRRIAFRCRQAGSNQNFSLASLIVGFRLSAEQATDI